MIACMIGATILGGLILIVMIIFKDKDTPNDDK